MTTKQLAEKFNVKVKTIYDVFWRRGHYKGYEPTGFHDYRSYTWEYKGE